MFDRAAGSGNPVVDFFGTHLTLPPEGRFGSVEAVRRYVADVLALPAVRQRWPSAGAVAVRARRGMTAAHYEVGEAGAVIAVPERETTWALRELVVLHEIAHHLAAPAVPVHGPVFTATMCELCEMVMGPEVGHVLRVVYAKEADH